MRFKRLLPIGILFLVVATFFHPLILKGRVPIPADTIIGLYHPYRDFYAPEYPNGIPYKNFLVTDPVRQQYPWRTIVIDNLSSFILPVWNPYSFAGYPLAANVQSAAFYPLNIIFFLLPFPLAWSVLVLCQPLLAAIFMFLYLRQLKISQLGGVMGAITYAFSGFFVAWMEWGTVLHVALWLPCLLYGIDRLVISSSKRVQLQAAGIVLFSSVAALLAGHLQTFFYLVLLTFFYWIVRARDLLFRRQFIVQSVSIIVVSLLITAPFMLSVMTFISHSARDIDVMSWKQEGWFIPYQHFIQFIAPDFFGNPATLNYWGVWNYGELVWYAGYK